MAPFSLALVLFLVLGLVSAELLTKRSAPILLERNNKLTEYSPRRPITILRGGNMVQFREASVVHGILAVAIASSNQRLLTFDGLVHATALGTGLWTWLGPAGWIVCVTYFALGSIATKQNSALKEVSYY